jgi:hypothetical protein
MIRRERIRHAIGALLAECRYHQITALVFGQRGEGATVPVARGPIERRELRPPADHRRLTRLPDLRAAVRMHQLDAGTECRDPLRERATYPVDSVIVDLTRQSDFRNRAQHGAVECRGLMVRVVQVSRRRWSRAHPNAECGSSTAQPPDEGPAGRHWAECTGRSTSHKNPPRVACAYTSVWNTRSADGANPADPREWNFLLFVVPAIPRRVESWRSTEGSTKALTTEAHRGALSQSSTGAAAFVCKRLFGKGSQQCRSACLLSASVRRLWLRVNGFKSPARRARRSCDPGDSLNRRSPRYGLFIQLRTASVALISQPATSFGRDARIPAAPCSFRWA